LAESPRPHGNIKPENILVTKTEEGEFKAILAEPSFMQPIVSLLF